MDTHSSDSSMSMPTPTGEATSLSPTYESADNSPVIRPSSPSLSISPSLALGACPLLDRSVSAPSTASTLSSRSVSAASEGSHGNSRRRGYMRPQGTLFADSARSRDSVMSLGSIAHMQYYFARTGLLDGKGAQLIRQRKKGFSAGELDVTILDPDQQSSTDLGSHELGDTACMDDQPHDHMWNDSSDTGMLPPTVSTYRTKPTQLNPVLDMQVLRRELHESLGDARKVLFESQTQPTYEGREIAGAHSDSLPTGDQGWHEIEGLHILDMVTLAIRAARTYYTSHSEPQKLYAIRSERQIRADLYQVLDILKRMANRNFTGGLRQGERQGMIAWLDNIQNLVNKEEDNEKQEEALRTQYNWLHGDWNGHEREREWSFLHAFDNDAESLPPWTETSINTPSPFLQALKSGIRLVRLHNEIVSRSKRRFGEISRYHTDLGKPYRCADNLRYWVKAAELRWEIKLDVNVLDVVYEKEAAWQPFDKAVLEWSALVRAELTAEWLGYSERTAAAPPELLIDAGEQSQGSV